MTSALIGLAPAMGNADNVQTACQVGVSCISKFESCMGGDVFLRAVRVEINRRDLH